MKHLQPSEKRSSLQSIRLVFLCLFLLACTTAPFSTLTSPDAHPSLRYAIVPACAWIAYSHIQLFRRQRLSVVLGLVNACAIAVIGMALPPDSSTSLSGLTFCSVFLFMLYGTTRQTLLQMAIWSIGVIAAYALANELLSQLIFILPGLVIMPIMQRLILRTLLDGERAAQRLAASASANNALMPARTITQIKHVLTDGVRRILQDIEIDSIEFLTPADHAYHLAQARFRNASDVYGFDVVGEHTAHGRLQVTTAAKLDDQVFAVLDVLVGQAAMAFDRVESSDRLNVLFENSADILVMLENDGTVTSINPTYEVLTGRSAAAALGKSVRTLLHSEDVAPLLLKLADGDDSTLTIALRWRCEGDRWLSTESKLASLAPSGQNKTWALNARDISERAALESELRHAQKLEAVGRLASGVAHEINTPIQFAGNNLHFLKTAFADYCELLAAYRGLELPADARAQLQRIEDELDVEFLEEQIPMAIDQGLDGTERVAKIVKAMKTFGHPDGTDQVAVDLNELISSTLTVARNEWKYVATVETDFAELPSVRCYAGDINQVLLNLVVNAAHAIGDNGASEDSLGRITVKTTLEGNNVVIAVTDTGIGIPDSVRDRIYDPFFTTKEVGRGTGQGLALAKTLVVDRHGGTLDVESVVGEGSTFTVRIPCAGARATAMTTA